MTPSGPVSAAPPPDGSPGYPEGYVIWQSNRLDAHHDIYRARADGSEVTRLTTAGALLPIWAPDGRWIAFHDDANTGYLMRPDGSELQTLSAGAPWFWLHDNSGLVVMLGGAINLYDVETQESRELISIGDFPQFTGASFGVNSITHDNRYLLLGSSLYMNGYTGTNGSFTSDFSAVIVDLLHKDRTYFLGSGCWPIAPPAGDLVYHVCADCPTHPDLYRMNLADLATRSSYTAEVAHENADWGHEYNPRVSNDNQWLAYMASTGCHEGDCDYDIWLHQLGADPSQRLRVTEDPGFDGYPQLFVGPMWQKTTEPRLLLTPSRITFFASATAMPAAQTIKVKNSGGGTLGPVVVTSDPAAPWLDVVTDGVGRITLSVRAEAVRRGVWPATVLVSVDGALGSPASVPVTLKADDTLPAADAGAPVSVAVDAGVPVDAAAIDAPTVDVAAVDGAVGVDAPVVILVDVLDAPVEVLHQPVTVLPDAAADAAAKSGTGSKSGGCGCTLGGAPRAGAYRSLLCLALVALGVGSRRRMRGPAGTRTGRS